MADDAIDEPRPEAAAGEPDAATDEPAVATDAVATDAVATDKAQPDPATAAVRPEPAADPAQPDEAAAPGPEPRSDATVGAGSASGIRISPWWPARRPSTAGALIGVLLALLGFGLVVQLRSNATDSQPSARPEDLVRILSDLDARKDRLSQEIAQLQGTSQRLQAGNQGRAAALQEAQRRADELGILAGTLAAEGSGMRVRLIPGSTPLKSWMVLDLVEELRGASAEAMQIDGVDGRSVRIVASTYFADASGGLNVDGQTLAAPYSITVIGDPQTMQPALNIPGGVVDTVHNAGGTVIVDQIGTVQVTALHQAGALRYAQPVS
ncbi:MAG: DUF881 domain-containing protein [Micromonosporaceae bacterium]|nr:DUF881 domain-containing protein [Micromonosporaceae bacterium]